MTYLGRNARDDAATCMCSTFIPCTLGCVGIILRWRWAALAYLALVWLEVLLMALCADVAPRYEDPPAGTLFYTSSWHEVAAFALPTETAATDAASTASDLQQAQSADHQAPVNGHANGQALASRAHGRSHAATESQANGHGSAAPQVPILTAEPIPQLAESSRCCCLTAAAVAMLLPWHRDAVASRFSSLYMRLRVASAVHAWISPSLTLHRA